MPRKVRQLIADLEKAGFVNRGGKYSGKIALRIQPQLHKTLAIKALQAGTSVNKIIQQELEEAI